MNDQMEIGTRRVEVGEEEEEGLQLEEPAPPIRSSAK